MFKKTLNSTFIFIIFFSSTYGQLSQDDTTLLLSAIRQISSDTAIVYLDSIPISPRDNLKSKIKSGKIGNISKFTPDTIILSKEEQNYILSELNTQTIWADKLFPNSRKMQTDSMWVYLKAANKKRTEEINRKRASKPFSIRDIPSYPFVFSFVKPIYIRNNSICLIVLGAMCGNQCGQTVTSFYKKENNTWREWIIISTGVF